jgi:hypothetical protein
MIDLLGVKYITPKEAAQRYGYSQSWFQKQRSNCLQPRFIKLQNKGKVYYPLLETDKWFKENIISSDD